MESKPRSSRRGPPSHPGGDETSSGGPGPIEDPRNVLTPVTTRPPTRGPLTSSTRDGRPHQPPQDQTPCPCDLRTRPGDAPATCESTLFTGARNVPTYNGSFPETSSVDPVGGNSRVRLVRRHGPCDPSRTDPRPRLHTLLPVDQTGGGRGPVGGLVGTHNTGPPQIPPAGRPPSGEPTRPHTPLGPPVRSRASVDALGGAADTRKDGSGLGHREDRA